jgi:hypothetical protein
MGSVGDAPTLELLDWVSTRSRTYSETMEAWQSHCPRLLVWEDTLLAGLLRVKGGHVELTPRGRSVLESGKPQSTPVVY